MPLASMPGTPHGRAAFAGRSRACARHHASSNHGPPFFSGNAVRVLTSFETKPAFRPWGRQANDGGCHEVASLDVACDGEGWRARLPDPQRKARARARTRPL